MGFLDRLKGRGLPVDQLKSRVTQFRSKDFAEASMAACALIAAADGRIDPAERQKTAAFIGSHDVLAAFDAAQLRESFERYCGKLSSDRDFGRIEALQAVGKLRSKPDQARAVVQVGVLVGGADGDFDDDERRAVRDLCTAVGLDPVEFGV
ncbi:tellurite resistance TerB family protein [Kineococcus indalonis]|uniref:tellurite resistance TerB family protein n=1 Tax=Kineococcus indalonis TaxID=2696566 RepID=UPI001412A7C2|nr:TerB family tellurite resistance protein [Kineococcus indalonis]NAZ86263.1 Tellurite resistance TerB [Kineococcus indalonis]